MADGDGVVSNFKSKIGRLSALGMNCALISRNRFDVPFSNETTVPGAICRGISLTTTPSPDEDRAIDLEGDSNSKPPGNVTFFRIIPSSSSRACSRTLIGPVISYYNPRWERIKHVHYRRLWLRVAR